MYRKYDANEDPHIKFSLCRLLLNTVPNFANTGSDELSLADKDQLFDFQIGTSQPKTLTQFTIWIMGCALNQHAARQVLKKLVAIGAIGKDGIGVDTRVIGKKFARQLHMLPIHMQKRTVCLLFEWEEELNRYASSVTPTLIAALFTNWVWFLTAFRWRVLEDEEKEIQTVLTEEREAGDHEAEVGHLGKRLMEIEGLKKLKPSLRERQASGEDNMLPGYTESSETSP